MDHISPDQCRDTSPEVLAEQAYALLLQSHTCVLAMTTGGCARYAFSTDSHYCLDRQGCPLVNYTSSNPHHHLIMTNSTMDLRLVHQTDDEGNELSLLLLTGMLKLVDPGNHDSIDRYSRYFDHPTENYSRGASRLYRLMPEKACFELFSGERINLQPELIIQKMLFTEKEESALIRFGNDCLRLRNNKQTGMTVAGMDARGVDIRIGARIVRCSFPGIVQTVEQAELALTGVCGREGLIS